MSMEKMVIETTGTTTTTTTTKSSSDTSSVYFIINPSNASFYSGTEGSILENLTYTTANTASNVVASSITSTTIRPRPVLASAFSFDSGYEVSPFSNYSFQFGTNSGESLPTNMAMMSTMNTTMTQDDYEGVDDELISIDHHFTPIHSPVGAVFMASTTTSTLLQSNRQQAFNLAIQRHENRLNQNATETEINNNNLDFPNQYDLFSFDDMGDDDVFMDENDQNNLMTSEFGENFQYWQQNRPSCVGMMYDEREQQDQQENNEQAQIQTDTFILEQETNYSIGSSTTSRCSSTPIPIPGAGHRRRTSSQSLASIDDDNFEVDMIDGSSVSSNYMHKEEYSLPNGRRMPYYHRLAPRLNRFDEPNSLLVDNDDSHLEMASAAANNRQRQFGSRFQISFSMIAGSRAQSNCYSPPLNFNAHWLPFGFLFRFGHVSLNQFMARQQQCYISNSRWQSIISDLYGGSSLYGSRLLTPPLETDEDEYDEEQGLTGLQFSMSFREDGLEEYAKNKGSQPNQTISEDNLPPIIASMQISNNSNYPSPPDLDVFPSDYSSSDISSDGSSSYDSSSDNLPSMDVNLAPSMNCNNNGSNGSSHHYQCSCRCGCRCNFIGNQSPEQAQAPLPDVVMMVTSKHPANQNYQSRQSNQYNHQSRHKHHYRNTLLSFHETPYHQVEGEEESFDQNYHYNHNERRTMSVSLPIDQEMISALGRELRQISAEFHTLQIQRSRNLQNDMVTTNQTTNVQANQNNNAAVSIIRSMIEMMTSPIRNHQRQQQQQRNHLNLQDPSIRTVNNSIFYTGQSPPSPQNSQNSTMDSIDYHHHHRWK